MCLVGPATLASTVDESAPSPSTSFVGNIPAAWVVPGLQLQVQAGGASKTVLASELKIGPQPVLSFVTMDWLLWGDTQPTPLPATFGKEYAARLPVSSIDHSVFPLTISMAQLPISPRNDGRSSTGATIDSPALIADRAPACSAAQATAGTCLQWSGYGILDAVRSLTGQLQTANGLSAATHWYGALGLHSRVGGGLGGPPVGSGDDYGLTFNHEFGHAFGQPHWGDDLYTRAAAGATSVHPYTGQMVRSDGQPNGGGFGNSWAFDPLQQNPFVDPVCAVTTKERQEPMQRSGNACVPAGETYDFASDYAGMFVARYFNGAAATYSGQVASPRDQTGNFTPPFSFPTQGGRDNFIRGAAGTAPTFRHWNSASATYVDQPQGTMSSQVTYAQQWDVPVYTLWGSFSNTNPEATTILAPLKYRGGLPRVVDPTNATDFAAIKANAGLYWWGADFVVRADFDDGTHRDALVLASARGTDPLNGSSFFLLGREHPGEARREAHVRVVVLPPEGSTQKRRRQHVLELLRQDQPQQHAQCDVDGRPLSGRCEGGQDAQLGGRPLTKRPPDAANHRSGLPAAGLQPQGPQVFVSLDPSSSGSLSAIEETLPCVQTLVLAVVPPGKSYEFTGTHITVKVLNMK